MHSKSFGISHEYHRGQSFGNGSVCGCLPLTHLSLVSGAFRFHSLLRPLWLLTNLRCAVCAEICMYQVTIGWIKSNGVPVHVHQSLWFSEPLGFFFFVFCAHSHFSVTLRSFNVFNSHINICPMLAFTSFFFFTRWFFHFGAVRKNIILKFSR